MADTQEQSLATITPVDGDYFRAVDDPGGSPASANVTGTALKAYLKTYNDTLYYGIGNVSYTTSDFSKTSDTTLADVTGLSHTVASGALYKYDAYLYISNGAGGTKVAIGGTCTATYITYVAEFVGAAHEALTTTTKGTGLGETVTHAGIRIWGYIKVNAGGTLTVQAAQNESNATATVVRAYSTFEVNKIG